MRTLLIVLFLFVSPAPQLRAQVDMERRPVTDSTRLRDTSDTDGEAYAVKTAKPVYPEKMLSENGGGNVIVKALVGTDGRVREARVDSGTKEAFNQSAVDAIMKWEFRPARKNGNPVESWVTISFKFRLEE